MTNKLTTALIGVAICIATTLTGCYQDKGNYDYLDNIGEPVIESIPGVTDRNNTLFCLENELVKLQPVMRFAEGTSEGDYSYEWKRYNKTPEGTYGDYKQPEVIGTSLNLEYKIAEPPPSIGRSLPSPTKKPVRQPATCFISLSPPQWVGSTRCGCFRQGRYWLYSG